MLLTVKQVADILQIRPSTLYAWAAQGKIPSRKIYGVLRFQRDDIEAWVNSFNKSQGRMAVRHEARRSQDIDRLIATAKQAVLYSGHGETISPSPRGREDENGAR